MSAFDRPEYLDRIARTQTAMRERGLDVLLVGSPENINYLSGYEGWSFYTPQLLALGVDDSEPLLVVRDMDVACAEETAWVARSGVVGYEEEWIGRQDRHASTRIAAILRQRGVGPGRVGVELDAAFLTPRTVRELELGLGGRELADATALVNWVRTVKSDRELQYLREAADISSHAMAVAHEVMAPGVRECDAAAAIMAALVSGTADAGGGFPAVMFLMPGRRAAAPHLSWTDAPLRDDTPISVELGGCRFRYHAGLARTFHLGPPPDELVRLAGVVAEGLEAALAAIRPGVVCEDVEAAWRRVLQAAGYAKASRIGYSIGLGFFPTWVEGTVSLQAGDRTPLERNMALHVICGMWRGAHNVELSETVRVTDDGHEVLTSFPRELTVRR